MPAEGLAGSITHAAEHCAAAIVRIADGYRAIGLDLEPALPLPPELADMVCLPAELAWLQGRALADRAVLARAIFCAKDCAYKAQYPLSRQMLEFHELTSPSTWSAAVLSRPSCEIAHPSRRAKASQDRTQPYRLCRGLARNASQRLTAICERAAASFPLPWGEG